MPRIKGRRLVHGRSILWAPRCAAERVHARGAGAATFPVFALAAHRFTGASAVRQRESRAYTWYAGTLALALAMLLLVGFASEAAAKSARGTAAPEAAGEAAAKPPAPGPARFFTINEILQKRDKAPLGSGGRTAAVEERAVSDAASSDHRVKPGDRSGLSPEPFGMFAFRAPDGLLWTKWRGLETELAVEALEIADCRDRQICSDAAARYLAILDETKSRSGRARIETVNRLVNGALRYVSDQQHHGVADRWQAPLTALSAARGDCEEYAIAKYMLLRATGFEEADLRLVLVRDTEIRVDHAVLAARFEGRWLVLDNRKSAAVETDDLRHYMPLYALGAEGVKLFAAPFAMWSDPREAQEDAVTGLDPVIAGWALRGGDYDEWTLRGSNAEPAGAVF